MMDSKDILKAKHLYARAGFGIHYTQLKEIHQQPINTLVDRLFEDSANYDPLTTVQPTSTQTEYRLLSGEERRELQRMAREKTRLLNIAFFERLSTNEALLREKMTLFLHGHFACRSPQNPIALQELNNIHRKYALGNFKKLTEEVSKSQAMLAFLNNQQNRKGKPNENFAR